MVSLFCRAGSLHQLFSCSCVFKKAIKNCIRKDLTRTENRQREREREGERMKTNKGQRRGSRNGRKKQNVARERKEKGGRVDSYQQSEIHASAKKKNRKTKQNRQGLLLLRRANMYKALLNSLLTGAGLNDAAMAAAHAHAHGAHSFYAHGRDPSDDGIRMLGSSITGGGGGPGEDHSLSPPIRGSRGSIGGQEREVVRRF